ncbi:MAG: AlpA family transcriptional regulator [Gemmatimonadales bacterium]|nr:AlpA family transcriptional regulator [Gemmatimonadales bacterium]MYG50288.1 AlpA family transcriptional regulator [Gemmatimonadales bacterium]MYK01134.1 AlpA family transcriptional regulator [Candidatus Palauibacter ramosifaciens]
MHPPTRFLRLPEVIARTGRSRSTIYVRLEERRFPRPVSLGGRAVGWIESEIDEWIRKPDRGKPGRCRRNRPLTSRKEHQTPRW